MALTAESCEAEDVLTCVSKTTEPLRTPVTFTRVAGSLMSDFIALSKVDVSELVHDDNDQPSRRNTKDDISGLGAGPGAGEGPGAGAGAEEDPGGDGPELQSELCQNHVDDDATHRLSVDEDDAPDLHIPRAGHHPQALAAVQSKQEDTISSVSSQESTKKRIKIKKPSGNGNGKFVLNLQ